MSGPYYPGQSARFSCEAKLLGALSTPPSIIVTVFGPLIGGAKRTTFSPSVSTDSTGEVHADGVFPITAAAGPYSVRWVAAGITPATTSLVEYQVTLQPLLY